MRRDGGSSGMQEAPDGAQEALEAMKSSGERD